MEEQAAQNHAHEPMGDDEISPEVRSMIATVSDAINSGLISVLRQVIKGQLAMADSEKALADMQAALAQARQRAKQGRKNFQLTLIDLIDAEIAQQLNDWRAIVTADDAEDMLRLRFDQLKAAMTRQSVSLGRLQDAQQRAVSESFEPIVELVRGWRHPS